LGHHASTIAGSVTTTSTTTTINTNTAWALREEVDMVGYFQFEPVSLVMKGGVWWLQFVAAILYVHMDPGGR
jgi:hypothetical protein